MKQIYSILLLALGFTSYITLESRCNNPQCLQKKEQDGVCWKIESCKQKSPKAHIKVDGYFYKRFDGTPDNKLDPNYFFFEKQWYKKTKKTDISLFTLYKITNRYYLTEKLEESWELKKGLYTCMVPSCRHDMSWHSLHRNEYKWHNGERINPITPDIVTLSKEGKQKIGRAHV